MRPTVVLMILKKPFDTPEQTTNTLKKLAIAARKDGFNKYETRALVNRDNNIDRIWSELLGMFEHCHNNNIHHIYFNNILYVKELVEKIRESSEMIKTYELVLHFLIADKVYNLND